MYFPFHDRQCLTAKIHLSLLRVCWATYPRIGSERDSYIHDILIWEGDSVTVEVEVGSKYVYALSNVAMA
jgi:hypothetical protein